MSGSLNALIAQGGTQNNPLSNLNNVVDMARGVQSLKQQQFALQQAQLQPAYQAMRQTLLTNPNASWDDVMGALAQSKRIGGNVDGLVANAQETLAKGGNAGDFLRAQSLGGLTPFEQMQQVLPGSEAVNTGAGTRLFAVAPALSATPYAMTETGYVQHALTPAEAMHPETINTPQGPVIVRTGAMVPGSGGAGAPAGGSAGAQPPGPPPGSSVQPGTPLSQKDADLAHYALRESGNQNIFSNVKVPGYTQDQLGSGYYQIIPSTWAEGQNLAGIPANQQTKLAIQGTPQQQYAVASALYDKYGGKPWAQSAPSGGSAQPSQGAFIGATTSEPAGPSTQAPYFRSFGATPGTPAPGAGASGIPGVSTGPGGYPVIQPVSPYTQKQFEQGATDFANDQQLDRALPQRTAPLQQALSILSTNKNLQTGPIQDEINHWQTAARALGMDVGTTQNITDYQTLAKTLAQNMRGLPGANNSDLARLEAQAASPNMMQAREAIQELAAKQLGLERMRSAQYRQFVSQNGGIAPASMNSQNYNLQTADWMAKQDPLAYSLDALPAQARLDYVKSLKGPARERFFQSYQNAKQLYGVDVTNAPE